VRNATVICDVFVGTKRANRIGIALKGEELTILTREESRGKEKKLSPATWQSF